MTAPLTPPVAPPSTVPPFTADTQEDRSALSPMLGWQPASEPAQVALTAASASSPGAIEQMVRAHQALAATAARIASDVASCVAANQTILIQDADGFGLIAAFRVFRAQAALLVRTLDALASASAPPAAIPDGTPSETRTGFAAAATAAAVSSAIKAGDALALPLKHIAALFQSRVSGLEARLVHADEAALVAEIARRLQVAGRRVLYPRLLPLELRDPTAGLNAVATIVDAAVASLERASERVAALAGQQKTSAAAELAVLASAVAQLRKQLLALPDAGPAPTDTRALIDGADRAMALDDGAALLTVQIAGTGSSPRAATLVHWKPAYTGGAVVSYFVADANAVILRSGTVAEYSSFREPASF